MSKILLDVGGYSWHCVQNLIGFEHSDQIYERGALFCIDSRTSIRKDNVRFYKAQRELVDYQQAQMRKEAYAWQEVAYKRYQCVGISGLEADDVIGLHYDEGDTIISIDKDFAQLTGAQLVDYFEQPWGFTRLQKKSKLNISSPGRWLTWQLCSGDNTDGIPRIPWTFDRNSIPWVFSRKNPLKAAIELYPTQKVKDSLNCLLLPTPLYMGLDPINFALTRYEGEFP